MKEINPISIWNNGQAVNGTILNCQCINDNLSTSATFYYSILSEKQETLTFGNLMMEGDTYDNWQTNGQAYEWVASQLNLTIIGDYVPPVSE